MDRARATAGTAALIAESFTGSATTASAWVYGDNACITAGSSLTTPSTSVPACGSNAPQDPSGSGPLQLKPPINYNDGFVFNKTPLASGNGLSITFDYFSFNAGGTVGDGLALVLTNAASPVPTAIGGCCGSLGMPPTMRRPRCPMVISASASTKPAISVRTASRKPAVSRVTSPIPSPCAEPSTRNTCLAPTIVPAKPPRYRFRLIRRRQRHDRPR